eukprot:2264934-Heterocapsa_arctica.AAC.1
MSSRQSSGDANTFASGRKEWREASYACFQKKREIHRRHSDLSASCPWSTESGQRRVTRRSGSGQKAKDRTTHGRANPEREPWTRPFPWALKGKRPWRKVTAWEQSSWTAA